MRTLRSLRWGAYRSADAAEVRKLGALQVALLGVPQIERDGAVVSFDTRKATALLAYLAVTGHAHSRDRLTGLLWPDYERARGRGALRRTLSVLNSGTGGDCLMLDRDAVALRPESVELDIACFRAAAADRRVSTLQVAARLYRDDFLAGFAVRDSAEYDDWQAFQADNLRRELAEVLERLVRARVAAGRPGESLDEARRWLALDPLNEAAHATLLRLYAWCGRRSDALRQYRECVRALDRELGVPPLRTTTALYDAIRAGRLPPAPQPPGAPRATDTGPGKSPGPDAGRVGPLVGRRAELAALEQARVSVGDAGRLVTVTGEAGIGKTRLLGDLAAAASGAGNRVVTGRCHQGEEGLAFGVIADLLRSALRVAGPAAAAIPPAWTREVSRLLPEVAPPAGPVALPTLDSPGAQSRFYAALVGALAAALGRGGVLIVEDVHWADDSSLDVLGYLVRRLPQIPLLVALSWRPDALPTHSPVPVTAGELRRAGLLTAVEPDRLATEAVRELAEASLPTGQATPASVARLVTETGGLPLFVAEYLDAFRRDGRVPVATEWQVPGGVRDLLQARLTGLAEITGQVLAAAAILGSDTDEGTLRTTSGRGEDEVVNALEQARRRGVLIETGPAEQTRYAFAHDGLRRLVSDTTSLARRRLLHGRAADALLGRRDAGPLAATIAGHLRQAGRDAEAAEWYWRGAERARSLYAHAEALDLLNAAVALGYPGHLVHQVAGDVLTVLGRYSGALIAYERAAASCPAGDRPALADLEHKLAEVHHRLGEWDVAASHLAAALELIAGAGDPALHARLLADLALVSHRRRDAELATRTAEEALALAASAGDAAALAQAYDVLGVLAAQRGDFDLAGRRLEASLDHARQLADPSLRVAALNNKALVLAAAGRPDEAVRIGREALARGLEHGDRHRAAALHTNLADLLHAAGKQAEALEHLKAAAALFAGVDDTEVRRPEIWKLAQW